MQTVAVTQSKNIQYSSVGYSVTFIPFDAFFSFWKGAEGVQVCGLLPCCPSFYSHWKRDEGSAAHQCACTHPLAFISNFSSLGKFLSESGAPDYIAHPAPLTTAGVKWATEKIPQQFSSSVRFPRMSSFFLIVLRSSWTKWLHGHTRTDRS